MKHKKKWLAVFVLLAVILVLLPYSTAYLSHVETKDNPITIGHNDIMIEEEFTPPKAWQPNTTYKKDVKIRNTGTVPCYIRVYAALSDADIPAEINFDTGRWIQSSDGYWYQNSIIEPGANTPSLFTKVTIQDAEAEQLKTFDVIIYAESVQAEGYSDIWDAFAGVQ